MEKGKKRKRNVDLPRITYHASDRTFERLFKEESLGEMEAVIRRKLGLLENTSLCLAQLREGKSIDLEDDDDFDAFYSIAHSTSSVSVRVTVIEDATPSFGAQKMLAKKKKSAEAKLGLTANVSHDTVENELIVVEDEPVPATEKDDDTTKFKSSLVRSDGDNDILEGTSKPCKKKKKSTTESVAVSEIPSGLISSPLNNEMNVSQAPPTAEVDASISAPQITTIAGDKNSAKSRNARRKDRLKKSQATPTVELPLSTLPTGGDGTRKSDKKKTQQDVPFADQLASAISETSANNRKHSGKSLKTSIGRQGEKCKESSVAENVISMGDPDVIQGVSLRRQQSVTTESEGNKISLSEDMEKTPEDAEFHPPKKRAKSKRRASTTDELEAANADVKAAFSRILAAKRASLSSSLAGHSPTQYPENTIVAPKDQLIQHPEGVTLQPTLNGKSDKSGDRVSEPLSKNVITNGLTKVHGSISDPSTSRSTSKSSDDGSEDQNRPGAATLPTVSAGASLYADLDLDALIRGPKISAKAIADSVSTSSSEDVQSLELAEDEEENQIRRRARKIVASDSSSEEDTNDDDDDDDDRRDSMERDHHTPFGVESTSSGSTHSDTDFISLGPAARLGKSEADSGYNDAFQAAEVADAATLPVPDHNHAAPAHCVANVPDNVQNSNGGMSLVPPAHNLTQKATHSSRRSSPHDMGNGSVEKQRSDGIIRRMKGRGGKYSDKDSAAGPSTGFIGQLEKEANSSTVISMDENGHTQVDLCLPQQTPLSAIVTIEGSSDKTMSMAVWTTLRASSPPPDVESTIMIDELQSSSPGSQVNVKNPILKPPSSYDPLFILSESQPPFPYSQWNGNSPEDHHDSNDSEDEEGHASSHSRSQSKTVQPPYRKLTDIAKQSFPTPKSKIRPVASPGKKLENMYGISGEEIESDSDTESDTDSDVPVAQKSSHIPKSRIAGISRQTRSALM